MKFIHAADLHLDTPFLTVEGFSKQLQYNLQRSTYSAATKMFDTAIRERVDFVILAGDTYDNTDRSLNAQEFLKNQFLRLKENNIKVYIIYGNHDYFRNDLAAISFPDNVFVFRDQISTFELVARDGMKVGLTGFSYYQQHVTQDMAQEYPQRGDFDYQIGILHAGEGGSDYAPFSMADLTSKGYDYWALGHIHKRQTLNESPKVIYSGDLQGRNPNETGPKGFYLATVLNNQTSLDFIESSVYVWNQVSLNVQKDDNLENLLAKITPILDVNDHELITLTLNNAQELDPELVRSIDRGDVRHHFENNDLNGVLYQIKLQYNDAQGLQAVDQKYWDESATSVFDLDDIKDMDSKLYNLDIIRDHVNDQDFLNDIEQKTKNVINKKFIGEEQ